VFGVVDEPGTPWADAAEALKLRLLEAASSLLPDNTGGAMLLGVEGVCVISHGSSSATAIVNAVRVARDCIRADVVVKLRESVGARDAR
jgi:phosphate acyltransferase